MEERAEAARGTCRLSHRPARLQSDRCKEWSGSSRRIKTQQKQSWRCFFWSPGCNLRVYPRAPERALLGTNARLRGWDERLKETGVDRTIGWPGGIGGLKSVANGVPPDLPLPKGGIDVGNPTDANIAKTRSLLKGRVRENA